MASGVKVVVVVVVIVSLCLVSMVESQNKKKGRGKPAKRRIGSIVKDLQSNISALWTEVDMLSQPVHVHIHGDGGHLMDSHDRHDHRDHDDDDDEDDAMDGRHGGNSSVSHKKSKAGHEEGKHDTKRDRKRDPKKGHKHGHGHGPDGEHHKGHERHEGDRHHGHKDPKCKKCKKMHGPPDHHGHHGHHGHDNDYDEEDGHDGTHVHIHLHTGDEDYRRHYDDDKDHDEGHHHEQPREYLYARCDVSPNRDIPPGERQNVRGTVFFREMPGKPMEMIVNITGFVIDPSVDVKYRYLRGMHGHHFGDMSGGCIRQGGHYNPEGVHHGGPDHSHRHPGDFGNLQLNEDGSAIVAFNDTQGSLFGYNSLLGRGIVIHTGADDLGLKDNPGSKKTGNAGGRAACCAIVACSELDVFKSLPSSS